MIFNDVMKYRNDQDGPNHLTYVFGGTNVSQQYILYNNNIANALLLKRKRILFAQTHSLESPCVTIYIYDIHTICISH